MKSSKKLLLASRSFTLFDQNIFAKFSGDFNPIHLDHIFARRTISGQCIVHGIHGLMWALESLLCKINIAPSAIYVRFLKPIFLNEEVDCIYYKNLKKIQIVKNSIIFTDISLKFDSNVDTSNFSLNYNTVLKLALDRDINDLINLEDQEFCYRGEIDIATSFFPTISHVYSIGTCCEIAAISEIIGMQIPGLHSLILSASINFQRKNIDPMFSIGSIDERFNLVKILINASSITCKIDSFLRQKPTNSAPLIDLKMMVNDSEFRNIKALIVGGSRGLGESVAKLIAVGGGESVVTYSVGYDDCLRLSKDISSIGRKCSIVKIQIPEDIHLLNELGDFNQIYYFPTPKIFGKRSVNYDENLYFNFYEIYVNSFKLLVNTFTKSSIKTSIFYPSSAAISSPLIELAEYIDAKIAGEFLCKELSKFPHISILVSRIPRTRTDQTMSLINVKSENPEDVMLPIVREMTSLN
jgi:hypothetical protein